MDLRNISVIWQCLSSNAPLHAFFFNDVSLHFLRFFLLCLVMRTNLLKSLKKKIWMNRSTSNSRIFMVSSKYHKKTRHFHISQRHHLVLSFFRFMAPYSLDVVTSASFSIEADSINNPDDPLVKHLKNIMTFRLLPFFLLSMYSSMSTRLPHTQLFLQMTKKGFVTTKKTVNIFLLTWQWFYPLVLVWWNF